MTTELSTPPRDLKSIIASPAMQQQFAAALPKHLSAERFGRIAITALSRTPKLKECTQESVFKCLLDLSAMGLEPDGRHAHLIPYGKECTLIVDYKGLVALVRRSGDVAKIHADIVCEKDEFHHSMGEVTSHTYDLRAGRGEPYAAYAQVTLKDGSVQAAIMAKEEIEGIRKRSRAGTSGPWITDWAEMAKKTAFRRLTKWLTISPELADAIAKADEHEFSEPRNVTPAPLPTVNPFAKSFAPPKSIVEPEEPTAEPTVSEPEDAEEAKAEAGLTLREAIRETEISESTFWGRAKKGGWVPATSNPMDMSPEALVELANNAQAIAEGVKKEGQV